MKFDHIKSLAQLAQELNDNNINPTMHGYSDFPTFGECGDYYKNLMQCNNNLGIYYTNKEYNLGCVDCSAYSYDKDSVMVYSKGKYDIISYLDLNEMVRKTNRIESQLRTLSFDKYSCFGLRWDIIDSITINGAVPSGDQIKNYDICVLYVNIQYFDKERGFIKKVKLHTMTKFSGMTQDDNLFRRTAFQVDKMRQFMAGDDSDYMSDELWSNY